MYFAAYTGATDPENQSAVSYTGPPRQVGSGTLMCIDVVDKKPIAVTCSGTYKYKIFNDVLPNCEPGDTISLTAYPARNMDPQVRKVIPQRDCFTYTTDCEFLGQTPNHLGKVRVCQCFWHLCAVIPTDTVANVRRTVTAASIDQCSTLMYMLGRL